MGKQIAAAVGAKILGGGYSYGKYDIAALVEAPDDVTMAAVAVAIAAGGAIKAAKTTPLLSGAQWVAALKRDTSPDLQVVGDHLRLLVNPRDRPRLYESSAGARAL